MMIWNPDRDYGRDLLKSTSKPRRHGGKRRVILTTIRRWRTSSPDTGGKTE